MSIADRLAASIDSTEPVTLDSIGTASELMDEVEALAANSEAPYLAAAFHAQQRTGRWTADHTVALRHFVTGLGKQRSYLALREAADFLLDDQQTLELVGDTLHDTLLPDANLIAEAPLLAGLRLDITLEVVARTAIAPYRLLALLTSPVLDYPEDFEEPLARAIGVASDIWNNQAERNRFTATLTALAHRGCDDAAYERAVEQLRDALATQNKDDLLRKIGAVRDTFQVLVRRIEARDDASAFVQACNAVIAFDNADSAALSLAARAAHGIANRRALHNHGMHRRNGNAARRSAELAWTSLAWRLETAASEIEEDAFLDTWVAVDAIIQIYEADRQFTNLRTVTSLIRPRLVNDIAQRHAMAHQLERAITIDKRRDEPELPQVVYELLELVHRARAAGRETADSPEDSSHGDTYLRALLGPAAVVLNELSGSRRGRLEEAARQSFIGTLNSDRPMNELIERITGRLVAELGENEAFSGTARSNFSLIVLHTIRFLVYIGDNAQPYTRLITGGETAPLEVELQKHFHQFLCATELAGRVGMEHANVGGGRADVITTFDGAQRYVTEVKRERNDAARENLETAYLAQALEYQSTSEPLGQLLVLDLTDHSSGTPHINDSIWVTHRRDVGGRITKSAVVAVVRGNRPTPSAMR